MLAEIHNKISQTGTNLSDRLEDQLTGDFFGTIRYIPFEIAMQAILSNVEFATQMAKKEWKQFIEHEKGYITDMEFWPSHHEGEIDLRIPFSNMILGIEVKYQSGISSEDKEIDSKIEYEESCHQLARYARMLKDIAGGKKPYLVFLAPYKTMLEVKKSLQNRLIIAPEVQLGFLSWEDVLDTLTKINLSQLVPGERMIIQDLIALLRKKGFMRYRGMPLDIVNKPISTEAYIFQFENKKTQQWIWPLKIIRKDEHYVFNNK